MRALARLMAHLEPPDGLVRLTVRRCYWPAAHNVLRASGASYDALATPEGMVLTLPAEQAEMVRNALPEGAIL